MFFSGVESPPHQHAIRLVDSLDRSPPTHAHMQIHVKRFKFRIECSAQNIDRRKSTRAHTHAYSVVCSDTRCTHDSARNNKFIIGEAHYNQINFMNEKLTWRCNTQQAILLFGCSSSSSSYIPLRQTNANVLICTLIFLCQRTRRISVW